jgi:hypothetical protein
MGGSSHAGYRARGADSFSRTSGTGIRYVLEGAITINWKEGKTESFEAGSTYFEGQARTIPLARCQQGTAAKGHAGW